MNQFKCGLIKNKNQPSQKHNLSLNFEDLLKIPLKCSLLDDCIKNNMMIQQHNDCGAQCTL
jgi:hypothetical protein